MSEIDFALNQPKETDQLELVGVVLWNKANKVGSFEKLSLPERYFVYLDIFESELNNGGLFHFLYNTSGKYFQDVHDAFFAVKAIENGFIYKKLISLFKDENLPLDIFKRREILDVLNKKKLKQIEDLELEFLACTEDLVPLVLNYIRQHKSYFEY